MAIKSFTRSTIENNIFYRSMLAGNTAYNPSDEDVLAEEILTGTQASVTFSGLDTLAAGYKHLQIRYVVRSSASVLVDNLYFKVNGASTNYANHYMRGSGSNIVSGAVTSYSSYYDAGYTNTGATAPANSFGVGVVDFLDAFATTKNKTIRTLGAAPYLSNGGYVALTSGVWLNTDAVTSITFTLGSGSYVAGSSFALIGVK